MIRKIYDYIRGHFLLRNLVLFSCGLLVAVYVISVILNFYTRHSQKYIVPDFVGITLEEAMPLTKEASLRFEIIDSLYIPGQRPGTIITQSPRPDMGVKSGRKIFFTINATNPRKEIIPYVTGYSLRQAKNMLENRGFEIAKLQFRDDIATNNVLAQSYNGKSIRDGSAVMAPLGSGITLTIGRNFDAPLPVVPKVIGLTLREAKSRLWEMGLNLGEIKYDSGTLPEDARVYRQTPNQQSRFDFGGRVSLFLTSDMDKISKSSKDSDQAARRVAQDEEAQEDPAPEITE